MANKTISLDDKTALIAARIPNFSGWVRRQLIEYARSGVNTRFETDMRNDILAHIAPEGARVWGPYKDACNPKHKDGLCPICYADVEA